MENRKKERKKKEKKREKKEYIARTTVAFIFTVDINRGHLYSAAPHRQG